MQKIIEANRMDAVVAMEASDDLKVEIKTLQANNDRIQAELGFSKEKLQSVLAACSKTNDVTDWVDLLGKRGERYNMYIKELGMQMMSAELSASQAVYCLTVFMMKTHPKLVPGVDYRIPGESVFKEWGEGIYDVVAELNRSRLEDARIIYYKHDDSPRNGFSYHGMHSECVFEDGSGRHQEHVPLGLELLEHGGHQLRADKGAEVLGDNISKIPAVMADNAAADVAEKLFETKDEVCARLKESNNDFTEEELEVMTTNFVNTCVTHGGDLASKRHHAAMEAEIKDVIVMYNCATLLQKAAALWLLRRSLRRREVRKNLLLRVWADALGRHRYHTAMKLVTKVTDKGATVKHWEVTGTVPSIYGLMCSMSNLISNHGTHSNYYLNESKDFRLFWVSPSYSHECVNYQLF